MRDSRLKSHLLVLWNLCHDVWTILLEATLMVMDKVYSLLHKVPLVVDVDSSIRYIVEHRCSVARYGDGEMKFIIGGHTWFQQSNPLLKERLTTILTNEDPCLLVCIPGIFGSLDFYAPEFRDYWRKYIVRHRRQWYQVIDRHHVYYDAFVSRCYLPYKDKSNAKCYFELWKQLWSGRDLLIVEGEKTRLGVGNDLFDNTRNISRILGPNTDAFAHYEALLGEVKKYDTGRLVLLALGPTATVMAADLSKEGYQAIDIGHLDIEYEWFLRNVDHKVPVDGKFVNEAGAGKGVGACDDEKYLQQVVWKYDASQKK